MAKISTEIATLTKDDSFAMRTIAVMSITFLPGTFVAVSVSIRNAPNQGNEYVQLASVSDRASTIISLLDLLGRHSSIDLAGSINLAFLAPSAQRSRAQITSKCSQNADETKRQTSIRNVASTPIIASPISNSSGT